MVFVDFDNIAPEESVGQVMLNATHQELLETADTLNTLSSYFSRVKNTALPADEDDELAEELQDYRTGGFAFDGYKNKLYSTLDLIDQLVGALKEYAKRNTKVNDTPKERVVGLEADQYTQIKGMLDRCVENLNECLFYGESDSELFRNLYSRILNTTVLLEDMADGQLIQPLPGEKKDIYGRTIHRRIVSDSYMNIESDYMNEVLEKREKEEGIAPDRYFINVSDQPLFPHEPTEDDLSQGGLGDCYMLATLAAIVRKDPARIKDHIRDNKDGTVTVLFYNENKEPVYVTVEKSIPIVESTGRAFSSGPLWVKLIEKAYAASRLKNPDESGYFKSYKEIEGGQERDFFNAFLGPEATARDIIDNHEILYSDTTGSDYSPEELDTFNLVQRSIQNGAMVTAGTRNPKAYQEIIKQMQDPLPNAGAAGKESGSRRKFAGINQRHAYTVLGTEERNGLKYIRVRNPHNNAGVRFNQNGELEANVDMQGEAYVELRNFRMLFRNVTTAQTHISPAERTKIPQARQFVATYGERLRRLIHDVKETEYYFNLELNDSPQFRSLDRAARSLAAVLDANPPLLTTIRRQYENFAACARAYHVYRTEPLTDNAALARRARNERTTRSRNRLDVTNRILAFADELAQEQAQAQAEQAQAPAPGKPDLQAMINEAREVKAPAEGQWITLELLNERVARNQALLQEEDFSQVGNEDLNKAVKQFANARFKELRHILCGLNPEKSEAISGALLEARAYILAGHSAEDLRKTDLAGNAEIAPYFELLVQAAAQDRAQRENDLAAAEEVIRQQRPDFHYAPARPQEAVQEQVPAQAAEAEVNPDLQMAKDVIHRVQDTHRAQTEPNPQTGRRKETEIEKAFKRWNKLDKKYGIPSYHRDPRRERFGNIAHVKMADRPMRKELSHRAVRLSCQLKERLVLARKATEEMIQSKYHETKSARFIRNHEDYLEAFLRRELTPEAICQNAELIHTLATGTPEQKAAALKARMNELSEQSASCQIEDPRRDPEHTLQQLELHTEKMLSVGKMDVFLGKKEGQSFGVPKDEIDAFKTAVDQKLESFTSHCREMKQIKDPLFQYIDKKAASDYLQKGENQLVDSLKKSDEALTAKEALPNGRKKDAQVKEVMDNIKFALAGILAIASMQSEVESLTIYDAEDIEKTLNDYNLNRTARKILKSEGFKELFPSNEKYYRSIIKTEEDGSITVNQKELGTLLKIYQSCEKAVEMNKKLEEDQKRALEEANREPAAPENAPNAPGVQVNPL